MKSALANLLLVAVTVVLCLAALEAALRITPNRFLQRFDAGERGAGTVAYRPIGDGLHTLTPDAVMDSFGPCFEARGIRTNSQGFRGAEWSPPGGAPRIAVLGDSYVEALQVDDDSHFTAKLANATGLEVMNFGVSAYATSDQAVLYEKVVRPLRPDAVVLVFFVGNDVSGNGCLFGRRVGRCAPSDNATQAAATGDGVAAPAAGKPPAPWTRLKDFLRSNLVLYQVMHAGKLAALGAYNGFRGHVPPRWRLYLEPMETEWKRAWAATETALARLRDSVKADGVPFAVILAPPHLALAKDWRSEMRFGAGSAVPDDFDPAYPSHRLNALLERLGIPHLDLLAPLKAYRDRHRLPYPFFSFACDGHWNPLTHALAASEAASFLAKRGMIPSPSAPRVLGPLETKRPEKILGPGRFEAIFGGGVLAGGPP